MKSSERRPRLIALELLGVALLASSVAIVHVARRPLADWFHRVKVTSDVYALLPPDQMIVASLGYRDALADYLWSNVLVEYGLHFEERRRFEFVGNYLDTINALAPSFRQPYLFADTLLTLQPEPPRPQDYEKAREILRRGMQTLPLDQQLWSTGGQFMAYLAPAHLEDRAKRQEWRLEGARALSRACELASDNENIPYHCVTAVGILNRAGEREAMIQMITRSLAVNEDPKIREILLAALQRHVSERERERYQRRHEAFERTLAEDLPHVPKDRMLVLGPRLDTAHCAGPGARWRPNCSSTWADWVTAYERNLRVEPAADGTGGGTGASDRGGAQAE